MELIHCSYPVSHHPEAAGLVEQWNALLKKQLKCQLGVRSLEGCVLQKAVCPFNQCPVYGTISPTARIHRPRIQGVDMGMVAFTVIS